jgi:hypothetical protein
MAKQGWSMIPHKTVMINNSTNKTNNHLSPKTIEHKKNPRHGFVNLMMKQLYLNLRTNPLKEFV